MDDDCPVSTKSNGLTVTTCAISQSYNTDSRHTLRGHVREHSRLSDVLDLGAEADVAYVPVFPPCSDFPVNTDPQSKNYMGDTYPGHETLPLLCHGGGYLVGNTLFSYILDNQKNLVMHRNEDVAVTLWLRGENSKSPE